MKEYQIRAEHSLNGKIVNGKLRCANLERVMKILAAYGYIVNRVVTL